MPEQCFGPQLLYDVRKTALHIRNGLSGFGLHQLRTALSPSERR
jgi:hypothetical protein